MSGPDKLDASKNHFSASIRGMDVYVVGDVEPADKSVGVMSRMFAPAWLFDVEGERLRALEDDLSDDEWQRIADQVDPILDEGDDYEVDMRLDEEAGI